MDELFLKAKNRPAGSIFYAVDDDANFSLMSSFDEGAKKTLIQGYEQKCGSKGDRKRLEEFIYITNITERGVFKKKESRIIWIQKSICNGLPV